MAISLDTNIWIFGITGVNTACVAILDYLHRFMVVVPNQVRLELERNLTSDEMHLFYDRVDYFRVTIDYAPVAPELVEAYEQRGLTKGDGVIAAWCEQRGITMLISENRDFLRTLDPPPPFQVLAPATFCDLFSLL